MLFRSVSLTEREFLYGYCHMAYGKAKKYAELLYSQALLIAGLPLEDPSGYTDLVCELMK